MGEKRAYKPRKPGGGRKKLKPEYDAGKNLKVQMDAAVALYNSEMSLQAIADALNLNPIKVRKLLITAGVYESDAAKKVKNTFEEYRKTQDHKTAILSTAAVLKLSNASVTSYLPYEKGVYFLSAADKKKISVGAERQRRYRAVRKLRTEPTEEHLWEVVLLYAGVRFKTYSGLPFTYEIRKGRNGQYTKELWIDRRENSKSLAWSSVLLALGNIKKVGEVVERPKALGDIRGVTYIYGMFYRFGLIDVPDTPVEHLVYGIHLEPMEMILTAKAAENQYVGVACGKLDQSCEVLSKKNHLLYLDTKDDSYELIPTSEKMKPYKVAIFFSGLERSLKNSKYNLRQDECKAAAYALMGYAGMDYDTFANTRLRDVPYEVFEAYKDRLPELWRRRAEHYYSEFARAEKGAELWRKGDLEGYGQLVFESGKSSIYNYECGCDELKKLYEIMADTDGIYGGRFSGAGFKGCCMALIDPDKAEDIEAKVTAEYLKAFPALEGKYSFHLCESADGVEL